MSRILFWNVQKKDLTPLVCDLARDSNADVIILNESGISRDKTLDSLKEGVNRLFFSPTAILTDHRFQCFCRDRLLNMKEIHNGDRMSVWTLGQSLLVLVHGFDIRNHDLTTRSAFIYELANELRFVQTNQGNNRFILVGDFNLNPFDAILNSPSGLNAMMTKACAAKG